VEGKENGGESERPTKERKVQLAASRANNRKKRQARMKENYDLIKIYIPSDRSGRESVLARSDDIANIHSLMATAAAVAATEGLSIYFCCTNCWLVSKIINFHSKLPTILLPSFQCVLNVLLCVVYDLLMAKGISILLTHTHTRFFDSKEKSRRKFN